MGTWSLPFLMRKQPALLQCLLFFFSFFFFLSQASSKLRTDISSCVVQSRRPSAGEQRQLTAVFLTRAAQSRTEGRQREETEEVLSEDDGGRGGGCVLVDSLQRESCEGSLLAAPLLLLATHPTGVMQCPSSRRLPSSSTFTPLIG